MTAEPSGVQPGLRLGPYEVVELLGRGARGEVWRAHDPRLGRSVAIKLLLGPRSSPEALHELAREARTASALSHPNIVTVHDVSLDSSPPFLVLELVAGRTLAALLSAGPLPVPGRSTSPRRSPRALRPRTRRGSSTGTSSPRTSS